MAIDVTKIKFEKTESPTFKLEKNSYGNFYVNGHNIHNKIILFMVGCGGTGSFLITNLLRLIKFSSTGINVEIVVVDNDVLEEKNLQRQNFHPKYLNQFKAKALSDLWGGFLGVPVAYMNRYLENAEDMKNVFFAEKCLPIIIGCTDSLQFRHEMNKLFNMPDTPPAIWIDSGNEEWFGQTIISTNYPIPSLGKRLPTIVDIFPEIFTGELVKTSEISCADAAEENIQNIGANIQAANNIFMILNQLLAGNPIEYHMLQFDVKTMECSRRLIEELK